MNDIETQPKTEQVRIYSKGSQLFSDTKSKCQESRKTKYNSKKKYKYN